MHLWKGARELHREPACRPVQALSAAWSEVSSTMMRCPAFCTAVPCLHAVKEQSVNAMQVAHGPAGDVSCMLCLCTATKSCSGALTKEGRQLQVLSSWRMVLRGEFSIHLEDLRIYATDRDAFVTCVEVINAEGSVGRSASQVKHRAAWRRPRKARTAGAVK